MLPEPLEPEPLVLPEPLALPDVVPPADVLVPVVPVLLDPDDPLPDPIIAFVSM